MDTVNLIFKVFGIQFKNKASGDTRKKLLRKLKTCKICSKLESSTLGYPAKYFLHDETDDTAIIESKKPFAILLLAEIFSS
jgi:hypothetical protein